MNIGFLITARLKSSRLPLKLLKDLGGRSVVERVIDRTKQVSYVNDIVLCTSTNPQDRPLADLALKNNIYYFLGSEEDVLKRLADAADFFEMDCFVNITGENPLFSIEYANLIADSLRTGHYDFVYLEGLPIGCACYGLNTKALKVICEVKKEVDTEIWGMLINRPDIFRVKKIEVSPAFNIGDVRITTDYIEDYQMIQKIYSNFPNAHTPSYFEVAELLKRKPEILKINAMRKQLALDPQVIKRIDTFYTEHKDMVLEMLSKRN
ncbi:cytidylyltransferase domain-containing protein [Lewinella sp. 4G2]|uniref:cytidylyltransferase domain-containing protein n=1 Tax=Lewinella sp. 4G2 TaxID=1803372 RepID=UPI0007B4A343|nr:3-deoxy-manno-octulosonate cytidylyltransferase [Lewinella sp. 4G2]OAV44298.1 3-deoxy-manno-octulosonate cytidylyltransferase [Lewinella sp. 4G2]